MTKIDLFSRKKQREIDSLLKEKYNTELIPHKFFYAGSGNKKIRIFTGDLNENELKIICSLLRVECIGSYFGFERDNELRISFDFASNLNPTKNFIELSKDQAEKWFNGEDLFDSNPKTKQDYPFVFLKYNDLVIGVGKITENKILNFVPKEKRITQI